MKNQRFVLTILVVVLSVTVLFTIFFSLNVMHWIPSTDSPVWKIAACLLVVTGGVLYVALRKATLTPRQTTTVVLALILCGGTWLSGINGIEFWVVGIIAPVALIGLLFLNTISNPVLEKVTYNLMVVSLLIGVPYIIVTALGGDWMWSVGISLGIITLLLLLPTLQEVILGKGVRFSPQERKTIITLLCLAGVGIAIYLLTTSGTDWGAMIAKVGKTVVIVGVFAALMLLLKMKRFAAIAIGFLAFLLLLSVWFERVGELFTAMYWEIADGKTAWWVVFIIVLIALLVIVTGMTYLSKGLRYFIVIGVIVIFVLLFGTPAFMRSWTWQTPLITLPSLNHEGDGDSEEDENKNPLIEKVPTDTTTRY